MMSHSHLIESQVAEDILRRLDHPQLLRRDRLAVGHTRAEARHLRLVRRGQTKLRGQLPNLRLRQLDFLERRADLKFLRRLGAGPEIANVAGVLAISDY